MTKPKWFAVDYAGFFSIQDGKGYTDKDLLDADAVGYEAAKHNAEHIIKCVSDHEDLIRKNNALIKALQMSTDILELTHPLSATFLRQVIEETKY